MADRKLFIGNLVRRITQEDLWVMYSTFGPLEECAKFHESFGFVRFLHAEDARHALDATHGITLKGRCIKVEFAATTTTWRSANNSNECRSITRYNIPPIRAVDYSTHRGGHYHHHAISHISTLSKSPTRVGTIGHRRKIQNKSTPTEPINPTTNSVEIHQSQISSSSLSPPSSYTASSSHITEIEDHDCDLDSGYNDEVDPSTNSSIPTSPWLDTPISDEIFVWDYQLYAQIARDYPLIKSDNSSSESSDDDTLFTIDHLVQLNIQEYL